MFKILNKYKKILIYGFVIIFSLVLFSSIALCNDCNLCKEETNKLSLVKHDCCEKNNQPYQKKHSKDSSCKCEIKNSKKMPVENGINVIDKLAVYSGYGNLYNFTSLYINKNINKISFYKYKSPYIFLINCSFLI